MTKRRKNLSVQYLARIAVLGALAAVLMLTLEIPIFANIYKLDFSNLPVMLAGFSMGIGPALATLALKDVIHLIIVGFGSTAGIGDLADFIMTAAYVIPAVLLYKRHKCRRNALLGMILGTVVMTAVAMVVNAFIMFPFYMKAFHIDLPKIAVMMGVREDAGMLAILVMATLPFNLLKGAVISAVTFFIYKPLSPILHVRR